MLLKRKRHWTWHWTCAYCGLARARDDVQFNLDHVAQKVRIIGAAKADAVVLAIDRSFGGGAKSCLAGLLVASHAINRERQCDFFRHSAHRECAMSDKVLALFLDTIALERDLRILFDVEEVCGAQVRIAAFDAGIDTGGFNHGFNRRLGNVFVVVNDDDVKVSKLPAHV